MNTELDRIERLLIELWSETLGVDRVSATDNLFDLGGTSLHAIRIVGQAEEVFGVHLSVLTVIAARDVHAMAVEVDRSLHAASR